MVAASYTHSRRRSPALSDIRDQLAHALASSYRIERELGGGGMSRVFLAHEVALDRRVVIKVLPPELAAEVSMDRFRREVQLLAGLQHPHIVPVLATGDADGLLWYAMPYIEGESLRARLAREHELPVSEAARILREVLDALAYAHARGVVHRDIKPDNILLSGGASTGTAHAMVADFGIAKAVSAAATSGGLTTAGLALGTPGYMAPEQAAGDPNVDARADLYAVGAIAYEMLAGAPPFIGSSAQALIAQHLSATPTPIRAHRPGVPDALDAAVRRALEKRPADRPQTASEMLAAIDAATSGAPTYGAPAYDAPSVAPSSATTVASAGAAPRLVHVLALFFGASALVVFIAREAALRFGLPEWIAWLAVALMAIGFPIVLATAVLHRSPTLAAPVVARRWLTWRRALTGGALALALWGAALTAYLVMRSLGIGPVASLLAAGRLSAKERLVVADFENHTADTALGPAATEAFRVDLSQSPAVTVLQPDAVREVLARMERPPGAHVDLALAREIATREGMKAVVGGDVRAVGSTYVVTAQLISARDGQPLVAMRETAHGEDQLLDAIDRVSKRMRERIGESLSSIQASAPLDRVTTSSLEALRAYSEAQAADATGDRDRQIALYQRAVSLDTGFAMAYRRLGTLADQTGQAQLAADALTKAYQHRDRLTERERLHAEASYRLTLLHDQRGAIEPLRALAESDSSDWVAWNNLAVAYEQLEDHANAAQAERQAYAAHPNSSIVLGNLVEQRFELGDDAGTDAMLAEFARRFPSHPAIDYYAFAVALAREQYAGAESVMVQHRKAVGAPPRAAIGALRAMAELRLLQGRLAEAVRYSDEAVTMLDRLGQRATALRASIGTAFVQSFLAGDTTDAKQRVTEALRRWPIDSIPPLDRPYLNLAQLYSTLHEPQQARAMLAAYEQATPPVLRNRDPDDVHLARALLAESERQWAAAAAEYRQAYLGCSGCVMADVARMSERLGLADSAVAQYERYLATRFIDRYPNVDPVELARVHERLGALYQARGDTARARQHYLKFIALWANADPELQPAVTLAKRELERISADRP